ncbi:MAG: hypothetical protein Ta2A_21350 [Treponemataceae bacterium]|nr:MAG: hypothetical protein Ta2A_21350 [Treponemataceae bacterium]
MNLELLAARMRIPARCARSRAALDISVKICYTIPMKKFHIVLTAVSAILVVSLFSCGETDKMGIFFDITNEIKLNEGKIHGNIMSMIEVNGIIYAGGGNQIWRKKGSGSNKESDNWERFSSPGGNVVALGTTDNTDLYAMTSSTSATDDTTNKYFKYTFSTGQWTSVAETNLPIIDGVKAFPYESTTKDAKEISGMSDALSWCPDGTPTAFDLYVGKTAGAVVKYIGKTDFESLPGKNFGAAIGAYQVVSIYADGDEIYVGIIGRTPAQGRKNNGLWYYDKARDVWDRV